MTRSVAPSTSTPDIVVDRTSPVPLYFQVARQLEQAIGAGRLEPGSRVPNEVELAERLALSRPTMRRAMQYLVDKGLVVRQRGVGTRVVSAQVRRSLQLSSLYDDLEATGQRPNTTVLSSEVVPAPGGVAVALGLPEHAEVTEIVRIRSAQDQPLAHMTNYLPAGRIRIEPSELEAMGLYELLRRRNVHLHSATQVIGARVATAAEARLFGQRRGSALLTMQRTAFDDHGVAVEFGDHFYDAARYSFQMSLLSTRD